MTNEELAVRLAEVDQRAKSNTRRIDKLEQSTDALNELTSAVREMVVKQDYTAGSIETLSKKVDGIDGRMDAMEQKPGRRWESLVEKGLLVLAGAFAAWLASGAPGL